MSKDISVTNFEKAFAGVRALSEKFEKGQLHYLSHNYKEQEVRVDFIDKLFVLLGWDVYHDHQHDPYQQEVKVERTETNQKRTDYTFFLAPNFKDPQYFVEAKKPSQTLTTADNYFQTVRYGWNAGSSIAVLTDFKELHVLDCRYRPDINTILSGAHKKFNLSQYTDSEKFKEIYYLLSREAVTDHSIDRYSVSLPKPRGKATQKGLFKGGFHSIDDTFLKEMDQIRETLAKAFKRSDSNLNSEELTEATQRTIDRLIFIRFLEDKQIEQNYYVSEFGESGNPWIDFISTCRKLDAKYNGIVFKKHNIDDQSFLAPDLNEFARICDDICHKNSPYDFNVIPIHILGSVYERFLGKVVHATPKRVQVEEKPEVRKAGGVYYTPSYIVDCIVQSTIGNLIEGKTPDQISKMRFADIACGSGSFLINVFDYILKYHNKYYQANPEKAKKAGCLVKDGIFVLSIKQKQKILVNNIYGADIDQQAIEVTQLSLALKMLEDETTATANEMQVLFHEKILPDLSRNIICGNSLIGLDILSSKLFPSEDERKLNSMDFDVAFSEVMKKGGFDAIVGNPPWVDIKGMDPVQVDYYFKNYRSTANRMNLYSTFIEKALRVLKPGGKFGYIIPNSILYQSTYTKLRELILNSFSINEIVRLPDYVFKNVIAETVIIFLENSKPKSQTCKCIIYNASQKLTAIRESEATVMDVNYKAWTDNDHYAFNIFSNDSNVTDLLLKIEDKRPTFLDLFEFCLGLTPYDKYKGHTQAQIRGRVFHSITQKDKTFKKLLEGGDVTRYLVKWGEAEYISYGDWLGAQRDEKFFQDQRILVRQIVSGNPPRIVAGATDEELYNTQTIFNIIRRPATDEHIYFLLGILNSKLINFYHGQKFLDLNKKVFQKILIQNCKKFPIQTIDFAVKGQKAIHDVIVNLVGQTIETKKILLGAKTEKDTNYYKRKVIELDNAIDKEVYKLYGMSAEEIDLIEKMFAPEKLV